MLIESLMAGDQALVLQSFASPINQLTDAQLLERCSVRTSPRGLIQQWQNFCAITVVQTSLADIRPRYAYELKAEPDHSTINTALPDGIAQQQQQLVRQYGGQCSPHGIVNGSDIGLNGPLNDFVGKILKVNFGATQVVSADPEESCRTIRTQLAAGLCVPIRISGVTGYMLETTFKQGRLTPLNANWHYQLTHVYWGTSPRSPPKKAVCTTSRVCRFFGHTSISAYGRGPYSRGQSKTLPP